MKLKIRKHKIIVLISIYTILFFAIISFISIIILMPLNVWQDVYALFIFIASLIISFAKIKSHSIFVTDEYIILPYQNFPLRKYNIKLNSILSFEKGIKKIPGDNNALVVTIKTNEEKYYFRSNYFLNEDLQEFLSFIEPIVHKNIGYK